MVTTSFTSSYYLFFKQTWEVVSRTIPIFTNGTMRQVEEFTRSSQLASQTHIAEVQSPLVSHWAALSKDTGKRRYHFHRTGASTARAWE